MMKQVQDASLDITLTPEFLENEKFYVDLGTGAPPFTLSGGLSTPAAISLADVYLLHGTYHIFGELDSNHS